MKVLLVKTSSMGDLIHTFPAVTDFFKHVPEATLDWLVDTSFKEIPAWHGHIRNTLTIPLRKLKKVWRVDILREVQQALKQIRKERYDVILDAQGLLKSALLSYCAKGERHGLDSLSAREPIASRFYQKKYTVAQTQHAVIRTRQLFANVLGYSFLEKDLDYGLKFADNSQDKVDSPLLFLPNTTWITKLWPLSSWQQLANLLVQKGYKIEIPWGNENEKNYAQQIASVSEQVKILPLKLKA
jgi:heptosyltransferase I